MIDKNKGEKIKLQALAGDCIVNEIYTFPVINDSLHSYYTYRNESEEYIREYGFSTANELKEELERLWEKEPQMEQFIKVAVTAALKNKPDLDDEESVDSGLGIHKEEKLPGYIYNF